MTVVRGLSLLLVCSMWAGSAAGQSTSSWNPVTPDSEHPQESLGEVARGLHKNKPAEVRITEQDAKELFRSVDEIFNFASEDTGLPAKNSVKRRLIGQADVEKFVRDKMSSKEYDERFARSEITMKKFGLLPREFDLRGFLVKSEG